MAILDEKTKAYLDSGGTLINGQIPTQSAPTGTNVNSPALITMDSLNSGQTSPIKLPEKPVDNTDYLGLINSGNAMVNSFNQNTTSSEPDWYAKLLTSLTPQSPASTYDLYNTEYANAGIDEKTKAVNESKARLDAINAELAGIDAETKAIPLRLQEEATGRGVTAGGMAPIQASELRKVALRALPLQAKALAEQAVLTGNQAVLDSAIGKLNTVFQLKAKDIETKYNYEINKLDKFLIYADKKQTQAINDRKEELATRKSDLSDIRNFSQTISTKALENGQADIGAQITSLEYPDINSKTFAQDLQKYKESVSALQSKIKPKATKVSDTGSIKSGTLVYTTQDQAEDSRALNNSRGQDGYVDPTIYQNLYKAWIDNGGQLEDFLKTYPPKNYVNPDNTWLPIFLMPSGSRSANEGSIVNPFN